MTISYHGLSLATRRMRYSFILEGYDADWQDTWENHVRYENLPPGEYTFKVIAINRDLVESEAPATVKFTVGPDPRDVKIATMRTEIDHLRREVGSKYHFENIIGRSAAIKEVRALMERAIDSGLTVLITGETGTGKELVAKAIHHNSLRKDKPMLDRNCGAFPKDLVSSELFGHRRGAFTGAIEEKMGLFEAATGGTVILDGIGEMPEEAQVHLLRVLQERKIIRLGEHKSRDVDVRIIAMSNRNLLKEAEAGRFREDLYFRLSEFPIHVPPLRERLEDIPLLAQHFLGEFCRERNQAIDGFAPDVFEMLKSYRWPGNVRELRNEIRRACAFVEEGMQVQAYHFSPHITRGESLIQEILSERFTLPAAEDQFQRRLIEDTLRQCNGNRTQAANLLGIDRRSLYERMKRLDIQVVKRET
ncbi:sigma 54-interacting transcriptional regulator [Candidatus Poribacteria bacterium]|nr:sigma 54-interacting transcriptional regulator [Candidatus Poribacteria bacterium]